MQRLRQRIDRAGARRIARLAVPLGLLVALALGAGLARESAADYDNGVLTSRADHIRLIVPRGWRASDQSSYPGLLLWMARSQPQGQIELTSEAFTRKLFCSWPVECRTSRDSNLNCSGTAQCASMYACALRAKLTALHMHVGPTEAGPKENEAAGLPSVWFEYDDGRHFLRQAIVISSDRAFSLLLSAATGDARATHSRAFEQALRTLQPLTAEESRADTTDAAPPAPGDAGPTDAGLIDGAVLDGGVSFESAPAPAINPIGPCK
ncbi:MAG TPA: hypothetical protein VHW23_46925 [Kofleriaceae bacterium]|jgi:hypothetical protein|nr:hypothetical protein [Kofleriaceae bacterium]